jgi:beta-lactamase class A
LASVVAVPAQAAVVPQQVTIAAATCTSNDANLAARLASDINEAMFRNPNSMGVTVLDRKTNTVCNHNPDFLVGVASIIKVTVVGTLLRRAQEEGRGLTATEQNQARLAITESNNDTTTAMYNSLGNARIQAFMNAVGMTDTQTGTCWGCYRTSSSDQVNLLQALSNDNPVLTPDRKAYLLGLMAQVVASQRWGTPAGAPSTATVHVKNGWFPSGGQVNSIGLFDGNGHDYMMTVLTGNSFSTTEGAARIELVARAVHRALNPTVAAWPTLREGSYGQRVQVLQRLLNSRGATLNPDGDFGPLTATAVRNFQSANGLTADGIVGPLTWGKLATTVSPGASGEGVRALQLRLSAYGLAAGAAGTYDATTEASVRAFQTSHGIGADGVVGPTTWQHLVS